MTQAIKKELSSFAFEIFQELEGQSHSIGMKKYQTQNLLIFSQARITIEDFRLTAKE